MIVLPTFEIVLHREKILDFFPQCPLTIELLYLLTFFYVHMKNLNTDVGKEKILGIRR